MSVDQVQDVQAGGHRALFRRRDDNIVRVRAGRGWLQFTSGDRASLAAFVAVLRDQAGLDHERCL